MYIWVALGLLKASALVNWTFSVHFFSPLQVCPPPAWHLEMACWSIDTRCKPANNSFAVCMFFSVHSFVALCFVGFLAPVIHTADPITSPLSVGKNWQIQPCSYCRRIAAVKSSLACRYCCLQVTHCGKLGVLSLRNNNLSSLPSDLGNMTSLRVLDVIGNKYFCATYALFWRFFMVTPYVNW